MEPLGIDGAWVYTPRLHQDRRGTFLESFQADTVAAALGHPLHIAQINTSVSARGTLRGIHFVDAPPGQAKYVMCVAGAILDVVVDVRLGSETFGRWESVRLDDQTRRAVYLAEGLGHAFLALTDSATVTYLCSAPYRPEAERRVDALDPALAIDWPGDAPVLRSDSDAAAPSLAEARAEGLLPAYADCVRLHESQRPPSGRAAADGP